MFGIFVYDLSAKLRRISVEDGQTHDYLSLVIVAPGTFFIRRTFGVNTSETSAHIRRSWRYVYLSDGFASVFVSLGFNLDMNGSRIPRHLDGRALLPTGFGSLPVGGFWRRRMFIIGFRFTAEHCLQTD